MTTSTHTHEELATKKDVDARFDQVDVRFDHVEERLDRIEERVLNLEYAMTQLIASQASMLNAINRLDDRLTALEESHREMMQILIRIENSSGRQFGF